MRKFAIFILMVMMGSAAVAETPSEKDRINYLLDQIAVSDITFIRNGEEHDGKWAKDHLAQKLSDAKKPDMTAKEFIKDIASISSHTGKPYLIKTADGKTVAARDWLEGKLAGMPEN